MSGCYGYLQQPQYIAAFVVVYGIIPMLGETGPGDNIGLVASKSCATGIRGQHYAIAAAMGKIGAFIGRYVFPVFVDDGAGQDIAKGGQHPFYVRNSLCFLSACIVWFLPRSNHDTIEKEDREFREYLMKNGFDITQMGDEKWQEKRSASIDDETNL